MKFKIISPLEIFTALTLLVLSSWFFILSLYWNGFSNGLKVIVVISFLIIYIQLLMLKLKSIYKDSKKKNKEIKFWKFLLLYLIINSVVLYIMLVIFTNGENLTIGEAISNSILYSAMTELLLLYVETSIKKIN